jgi:hypothetical protein
MRHFGHRQDMKILRIAALATLAWFSQAASALTIPAGGLALLWAPPVTMANGRTPVDVVGYRINIRSLVYTGSLYVGGPALGAIVTGLPAGLTHFTVAAVSSNGSESAPSFEVSKTIVYSGLGNIGAPTAVRINSL